MFAGFTVPSAAVVVPMQQWHWAQPPPSGVDPESGPPSPPPPGAKHAPLEQVLAGAQSALLAQPLRQVLSLAQTSPLRQGVCLSQGAPKPRSERPGKQPKIPAN